MPARIVWLAHHSPGRVRFRLSWLRDHRDEADPIADALAKVPGVREVRVRPYTGSVLCLFDPARCDGERVGRALLVATGVAHVTLPGDEDPADLQAWAEEATREASQLSRVLQDAARGLHVDFLRLTEGRASLGTAATLLMWASAAAEVAATGKLPLPSWHELVYWGFRTFGALEDDQLDRRSARLASDPLVEKGDSHG